MNTQESLNKILKIDALIGLSQLDENSIDTCITDPPYNYEFIGKDWNYDEITRRIDRVKAKDSKTLVKHVPYGSGLAGGVRNQLWYKKNRQNILNYSEWIEKWGKELFKAMKPGGYVLVFNSTRTIAHVQTALENVGFYARDIIVWRKNSGIPKGTNLYNNLKSEGSPDKDKWQGWHSCLRNEWESISVVQKPLENNYYSTFKKYGVGFMKTNLNEGFQSNIIEGFSNRNNESFNIHTTIKPLELIEYLIKLTTPLDNKSRVVLDPFMGSGTTAVAAYRLGIHYIGYELVEDYIAIAEKRIKEEKKKITLFD